MFGKAVRLFILLNIIVYSQSVEFRNYSVQDGLSNNKVNCVLQDKAGFIWFGTEDGLNRFDGYEFKLFRPSSEKNSIVSKDIWSLYEDEEGNIWIGSKNGDVIKLDYLTQKFSSWKIEEITRNDNSVTAIYVDGKKNVWVGTYQQGLFKFDQSGKKNGHWDYNPENPIGISNNFITSILEDKNDVLWISTYFGLNEFNPEKPEKGFTKYLASGYSLNNNLIWELVKSSLDENRIWICTASGLNYINTVSKKISTINIPQEKSIQFSGSVGDVVESIENNRLILYIGTYGGLVRYDLNENRSVRFVQQKNNPKSIISNQINQMIKDKSGVIWLASENGVSSLSIRYNFLIPFSNFNSEFPLRSFNSDVKSILNYDDKNILVGTSTGLFKLNLQEMTEIEFPQFKDLNIWSLYKDDNNILWVGTYGQGLYQLNIKSNTLKKITIEYPLFKTLAYNYIKDIKPDSDNNLFIGSWGGGLVKLVNSKGSKNNEQNELKFWRSNKDNSETVSYNDVWSIVIDKVGRIWIGTNGGGLNYFNEEKNKFTYLTAKNSNGLLKSNSILFLYQTQNKAENDKTTLWICTDQGLTKLVLKNLTDFNSLEELILSSKTYTSKDGLSSEVVKSVVENGNGDIWVSTSNGIFVYDDRADRFNRISYAFERRQTNYNSGASLNFKDKFFLFGSIDGLKVFQTKQVIQSDYKPEVIISDFQLFNKSVSSIDNSPIKSVLNKNGEIKLSYNENVFSFQFTATDYNNPSTIKYAYMMKGFDKDWNYTENRRFVTYTNLNPGEYEFLVKATNSDGLWNDIPTAVKVIISPPWWRTVWAYIAYIFLFFAGILTIRRLEINKAKLMNEIKMKDFEAEKLREVEAMKSRFFANISHELRTPLMLIKGPIDELLNNNSNTNVAELAGLAARNSEKLKSLIDQLLELTQLESAKIPVKAVYGNIVEFNKNILWSFKNLADQKQIELIFESEKEKIMAWFDKDILEKILNNILSNALKFTNAQGKIGIKISCPKSDVNQKTVIKIFDTGIGIDEKDVNKVFDRFYQSTESVRKNYAGFGIGLSLVKELVDLHKWEIRLLSEKMKGTEFLISIPLNDYLDETQKMKEEAPLNSIEEISESIIKSNEVEDANTDDDSGKFTLMIVEDSEDVRYYLSSLLKNQYKLIIAENGLDAINKSLEQLPDLIISDIMMPEMDGLEFCQRIKNDWRTSHIPVILLTARTTIEDKVEGLETGADDYLYKPFNSSELYARIKNLISQRIKLKEKFSKSLELKPEIITDSNADQEFINRAIEVAENNIYNLDFNTDKFAKEMFLSRSQLYRKLNSLTNQSPGEFIRTVKLKKAAKLLIEKKLSITQIALEIGFNSPSHFTKAFKQLFDCLPSEFISKSETKPN
ncbi:MAG: hybrid sensor histidine kinase/response regulator transcription factor [Ignavibacterium sp.]